MVTGDGLHCFDGRDFRVYRVPFDGAYNHSDNLMRKLIENTPGELIIESTSSLLSFNTTTAEFRIIYRKQGSNPVLLKMKVNGKSMAWLNDQKLCLIDQDKLVSVKMEFPVTNQLPANFSPVRSVKVNEKEMLLCNEAGIIVLHPGNDKNKPSFIGQWFSLPDCQSISKNSKGQVFILAGGKIYRYIVNGSVKMIFDTHLSENLNLFIDSKDIFWLSGKTTKNVYHLKNQLLKKINLCENAGRYTDTILPVNRVVYEDKYHNIWLGTDGDGILLYNPGQVQFNRTDIGFTRCLEWFDGHLWAGTFNNGIWKLSADLAETEKVKQSLFANDIYFLDMAADDYGRLWIISRQGLEVIDKTGAVVYSKKLSCTIANFFAPSPYILALAYDTQLILFKLGAGSPEIISHEQFTPVATYLNSGDYYWLGNQFGIYRIRKMLGYSTSVFSDSGNYIYKNQVNQLLFHDGNIWAATGNGIEIFNENGQILPLPDYLVPLREEMIYTLQSDRSRRIWFTGNRGMACIDEKKKHIVYFGSTNNLQSLEFNNNASCPSPDGSIYFGGIRGINGFNPQQFLKDKKVPEVRLAYLMVADSSLVKGIPATGLKLDLNRRSPNISGKLFSPDYACIKNQQFSFYLEGFHHKWSNPSIDARFNFRDLPPGEYRLFARSADAWNNWSTPVEILSVTLKSPFWKTRWFLALMIAVVAGATALFVKRINSLRYRKRILALEQQHAIEKERLRISKDMHDEVGASLTRISILSELARKQHGEPEKAEHVIGQISEIAGNVVDEMSEIIWAMNPRNDTLDGFVAYTRRYTSSYLETTDIGISFHFTDPMPPLHMNAEIRRNLFLVIKEALHNVVKHAKAGRVSLSIILVGKQLSITLTDDGVGISNAHHPSGNGLINMRKRLDDIGGSFELESQPGKGTAIMLKIEMTAEA